MKHPRSDQVFIDAEAVQANRLRLHISQRNLSIDFNQYLEERNRELKHKKTRCIGGENYIRKIEQDVKDRRRRPRNRELAEHLAFYLTEQCRKHGVAYTDILKGGMEKPAITIKYLPPATPIIPGIWEKCIVCEASRAERDTLGNPAIETYIRLQVDCHTDAVYDNVFAYICEVSFSLDLEQWANLEPAANQLNWGGRSGRPERLTRHASACLDVIILTTAHPARFDFMVHHPQNKRAYWRDRLNKAGWYKFKVFIHIDEHTSAWNQFVFLFRGSAVEFRPTDLSPVNQTRQAGKA